MAKKPIKGTAKADKIKVTESDVIVNAGKGNDIITLSKGKKNIIHGDAGIDTIAIEKKAGTGNKIYGDAGKDKITINGGKSNYTYGGNDNDTITLSGGKKNTIHGDAGNDSIIISKTAGTGNKVYGDVGADTIKVQGGNSNFVYGGKDGDKITLSGGSKNKIYGDDDKAKVSGKDTITVNGGSGNYVYGGNGIDTFKVQGGNGNFINGGNDGDAITVSGGTNNTVHGDEGNDTVTIEKTAGTGNKFYGDAGSDKVFINGGMQTVDGGADADTITVNGGNSHILRGGAGSDTYVINPAFAVNSKLTINQSGYETNDADVLQLTKINSSEVDYSLNNNVLTIAHKSGGTIAVTGWDENPLAKIEFADKKSVTGSAINSYLKNGNIITVNASGIYNATNLKDVFRFGGKNWNATIAGATGEDVIDVSSYNDDSYEMDSFYREDDDLKVTFKPSWDNELTGSLTIQNYFATEDRISNLIWYHQFTSWFDGEDSGEVEELNVVVSDDKENTDITGTDRSDLIITGNGNKTVFAGVGNDRIHVGWKDRVNDTESFGNQIINAGPGNDTIWVEDFSDGGEHILNGGDGDDLIYTSGYNPSNNVLNGDAGNDNLQATGTGHKLYGGEGNDELYAGGTGNKLYGGEGNDHIEVNGDSNVLNGGEGNDALYGGGNANTLNGGDGDDDIAVYVFDEEEFTSTDNNIINGGAGDDSISVGGYLFGDYYEGNFNSISGGFGEDSIYVRGNNNTVNGDDDDDYLDVGGDSNVINGGIGNDTISIGGDNNTVDGGDGDDVFTVTDSNNNLIGGKGSDTYIVDTEFTKDTRLTINQAGFVQGDADVLCLTNESGDDMNYSLDNGTLTITHVNGGMITVKGWDQNPLAEIQFADDESVSLDEINAIINPGGETGNTNIIQVNASETYNGTKDKDIFVAGGSGWNAIITDIELQDVLNLGDYGNFTPSWNNGGLAFNLWKYVDGNYETASVLLNGFNDNDINLGLVVGNEEKRIIASKGLTVNGTDNDDVIIVSDGQTVNAKKGNDSIHVKYGDNNIINCGDGDDNIKVFDGDSNVIYGEDGDDYIECYGAGNAIYGGAGDDEIRTEASFSGPISGGYGSDTYVVSWTSDGNENVLIDQTDYNQDDSDVLRLTDFIYKDEVIYSLQERVLTITHTDGGTIRISGWDLNPLSEIEFADGETVSINEINTYLGSAGSAKVLNGTDDDDKLSAEGDNYTINGFTGNDTITVVGNSGTINSGSGADIIAVEGNENTVRGQNGNDTISVSGDANHISSGEGNNEITLSDGDDNLIYCSDGNDTIKIEGGAATRVESGKGDDTIILSGGSIKFTQINESSATSKENYIYAEEGNDTIRVTGGNGYMIYAGSGDDTIIIDKPDKNISMHGDKGSDTYIINSLMGEGVNYFVYNNKYDSSYDKDVLQLSNISKDDVDYDLYNATLYITHKDGGIVKIYSWTEAPLYEIIFADGVITDSEINVYLDEKLHAVYTGTEGQDTFSFSGSGWDITITGAKSNDIIDLSNYNGYDIYDYGDFNKVGNDLRATFASEGFSGDREYAVEIGAVTIQDYFNTEDKISNVLWYNFRNPEGEEIESMHVVAGDDEDGAIYGTDGRDLIVTGGGNTTVDAGSGNDVLVIKNLEAETDMSGSTITVRGGLGSDRYDVATLPEGMNVIIDQQDFSLGDKDKLNLLLFKESEVQTSLDENNIMHLTADGFGTVSITNWNTNPLDKVQFSDRTISGKYI